MNLYLILLSPIILYLLVKLYEYHTASKVKNIKTGKKIPSSSMFQLLKLAIFRNSTYFEYLVNDARTLGSVYANWVFGQFKISVSTPELAAKVMLDTKTFCKDFDQSPNRHFRPFLGHSSVVMVDGEDWKRQRTFLDPAFYRLETYCDAFAEKTNVMIDVIEKRNYIVDDITVLTQKLTLDILGKTIFDHEFNSLKGSIQQDLSAYHILMNNMLSLFYNLFFPLTYIPFLPHNKRVTGAQKVLDDLCYRLIEESKKKKVPTSMLDYIVRATEHENGITLKELRDNIVLFFVAGHETTATALGFAMHVLAEHQDIQEKVRKEIDEKLKGKPPTYQDLQKLEYLGWVIKEVLRMYPPVTFVPSRRATKNVVLGDYKIPKGFKVGVNIAAIHFSKEIYGDPENFRPERWSPEESKGRHHFSWIPFAGGPRICIGNNFSLLEQKIFLSLMLQKFQWEMVDKTAKTEFEKPGLVLAKPVPVKLKFNLRA